MSKVVCNVCPHHCKLDHNQVGLCRARQNVNDSVIPINYGLVTGFALDPIEKKPLRRFYPGKYILSIGSFGCNLKCSFCQNHDISMADKEKVGTNYVSPQDLISMALSMIPDGNIGIAYTYNEPLVGYEYIKDCARLAREHHLKNVLVTNGCFSLDILSELQPYIDAMNIDLKGYTQEFYKNIGGDLETVKAFILHATQSCHIEITTLLIPGENDSEEEIRNLASFIAGISPDIPLHLSRFFPRYKMLDKQATSVASVYHLAEIAREYLNYVYEGNV